MLYQSAILSLIVQVVILFVDFYGLNIEIPPEKRIFNQLLQLELGVQVVEIIFYIWLIYNFSQIDNITPKRYYDWIITTPIMLITLIAYLNRTHESDLSAFISNNKNIIIKVVVANMIMLIFGLLGEYNVINYNLAIILGFIPFLYYFYIIYKNYIQDNEPTADQKGLFIFFFVVWSLYGLAAFLPYILKNTAYNILDLVAKNLFGVFLVYIIWTYRVKKI
jgi:bacteriorhodopsin